MLLRVGVSILRTISVPARRTIRRSPANAGRANPGRHQLLPGQSIRAVRTPFRRHCRSRSLIRPGVGRAIRVFARVSVDRHRGRGRGGRPGFCDPRRIAASQRPLSAGNCARRNREGDGHRHGRRRALYRHCRLSGTRACRRQRLGGQPLGHVYDCHDHSDCLVHGVVSS